MMVAVSSDGVSSSAATAIDDSRAGSILLLGNTTAGAARVSGVVDRARAAARTPKGIDPMLAADQEGGQVQRLQGKGFDRIPSAQRQAEQSPSELESDATRWGRQLKRAGIDAALAPVADVVPKDLQDRNQPIGVLRRGYGSSPAAVAPARGRVRGGHGCRGCRDVDEALPGSRSGPRQHRLHRRGGRPHHHPPRSLR